MAKAAAHLVCAAAHAARLGPGARQSIGSADLAAAARGSWAQPGRRRPRRGRRRATARARSGGAARRGARERAAAAMADLSENLELPWDELGAFEPAVGTGESAMSRRLRTASELHQSGLLNGEEKATMKQLVLQREPKLEQELNALQQKGLSQAERKSSFINLKSHLRKSSLNTINVNQLNQMANLDLLEDNFDESFNDLMNGDDFYNLDFADGPSAYGGAAGAVAGAGPGHVRAQSANSLQGFPLSGAPAAPQALHHQPQQHPQQQHPQMHHQHQFHLTPPHQHPQMQMQQQQQQQQQQQYGMRALAPHPQQQQQHMMGQPMTPAQLHLQQQMAMQAAQLKKAREIMNSGKPSVPPPGRSAAVNAAAAASASRRNSLLGGAAPMVKSEDLGADPAPAPSGRKKRQPAPQAVTMTGAQAMAAAAELAQIVAATPPYSLLLDIDLDEGLDNFSAKEKKNERERRRRLQVSHGFSDLFKVLRLPESTKMEKSTVLGNSTEKLDQLNALCRALKEENIKLRAQCHKAGINVA